MSRLELYLPPCIDLEDFISALNNHIAPAHVVSSEDLNHLANQLQHGNHAEDFVFVEEPILVSIRRDSDKLQAEMFDLLWNKCASVLPELTYIPKTLSDVVTSSSHSVGYSGNPRMIGSYQIDKLLAESPSSSVYECHHCNNPSQPLAIKSITKSNIQSFQALRRLNDEIRITSMVKHEYILSLLDVFATPRSVYLVTHRGAQDLFAFLHDFPDGLSEARSKSILACLIHAISHCHALGIAHRGTMSL